MARSSFCRLLGVGIFLVSAMPASGQELAGPEGTLVVDVRLAGVHAVDPDVLLDGLVTQATTCRSVLYAPLCLVTRSPIFARRYHLDRTELRRDALRIRLYYWRRGYRDVVVTSATTPQRGGVRVTFTVDEQSPTRIERLTVVQDDTVLPAAVVERAIPQAAGDPLDMVALDSSVLRLRSALWERGRADATVTLDTSGISNATNGGPVTITLNPGARTVVARVEVEGNRRVSERTVRRLLRIEPGDLYRRRAVERGQRDAYLSGLFREVEIGVLPTNDSAKTVVARVDEAPQRRVEFAGGVTTLDFLQLDAQYTRYAFLGGARRLALHGTVSNLLAPTLNGSAFFYDVTNGATGAERRPFLRPTWSASVDLAQPFAFGTRTTLGTSLFTHRRSVPGVVTDRGAGATIAATRALSDRTDATLSYTWESSRIDASDVYFCVAVGLCVPSSIEVVRRPNPLAPLSFVVQYDATDAPLTPTHGVRVRLDLEHASGITASDFAYNRAAITASSYHEVARRVILAGRVRIGAVKALATTNRRLGIDDPSADPILHPRKYFFSGGARSVRGYGENQLGPRILTIDPAQLTDTTLTDPCTVATLASGACDPNIAGVPARAFQPRPLGGTSLAEASVELRFPLVKSLGVSGAVFTDAAVVGTSRFSDLLGASATVTPGFGVRVATPAGPVRLDLGIRPQVVETLPVITQVTNADGTFELVTLRTPRRFDQAEATGGFLRQLVSRLTLHLAIGPAF